LHPKERGRVFNRWLNFERLIKGLHRLLNSMSLSSRRGRFLVAIGSTSFPFAWKFKCAGRSLHGGPFSRATHSSLITVAKLHCHSRANSFDFSRRFFDDCCVCRKEARTKRDRNGKHEDECLGESTFAVFRIMK